MIVKKFQAPTEMEAIIKQEKNLEAQQLYLI